MVVPCPNSFWSCATEVLNDILKKKQRWEQLLCCSSNTANLNAVQAEGKHLLSFLNIELKIYSKTNEFKEMGKQVLTYLCQIANDNCHDDPINGNSFTKDNAKKRMKKMKTVTKCKCEPKKPWASK